MEKPRKNKEYKKPQKEWKMYVKIERKKVYKK